MGDSQVFRVLPAHLLKHLHVRDEAFVFTVGQFDARYIMVAIQKAIVIRRCADACAERIIRVAVDPYIKAFCCSAAIHIGKHLRHLAVSRHAADVGNLQPNARATANFKKFFNRVINFKRIPAHMGCKNAAKTLYNRRHGAHFAKRHAGLIAYAHGKALRPFG